MRLARHVSAMTGRVMVGGCQATELELPDVAAALRPLLTQIQDHVIDLRDALGL
jgi:hypothetical protein